MEDINYKKLLKQEKEFDKFIREVTYALLVNDSNAESTLAMMYHFYQSGQKPNDMVRMMRRINNSNNN